MRYTGRLKKWNAERGFGFVIADDGGAELFVHIKAFGLTGPPPAVGDLLSFEVQPDRDGKKRAVRVQRVDDVRARRVDGVRAQRVGEHPAGAAPLRSHRMSRAPKSEGTGLMGSLIAMVIVCAMVWFGYNAYANRAAKFGSILPAPALSTSVPILSGKLPVPPDFRCDGRRMCSQMTSCKEAKLFLQNCPGTQMDGNGDGVPCEQQWCTK